MKHKLYIALWNWQVNHTTPRWISLNTGEVTSHLGRLMAGRWLDRERNVQYVWVSLRKYESGRYDKLLSGEVDHVTEFLGFLVS